MFAGKEPSARRVPFLQEWANALKYLQDMDGLSSSAGWNLAPIPKYETKSSILQ